jgi:hypothetical protein
MGEKSPKKDKKKEKKAAGAQLPTDKQSGKKSKKNYG